MNLLLHFQISVCDEYSLPFDFIKKRPSSFDPGLAECLPNNWPSPSSEHVSSNKRPWYQLFCLLKSHHYEKALQGRLKVTKALEAGIVCKQGFFCLWEKTFSSRNPSQVSVFAARKQDQKMCKKSCLFARNCDWRQFEQFFHFIQFLFCLFCSESNLVFATRKALSHQRGV